MRTIAKLFLLLFSLSLAAQTARYTNLCSQGATQAAVSGLKSTNYQESAFPSCSVKVYLHNTTTLATLYSDSINTPLANPFTAGVNAIYGFYASTSNHYDIVMSATGMTTTTISDVILGGGGGGSSVELQTNGVDNQSQTLLNLVAGDGISLANVGGAVTISQGPTFAITSFTASTAGVKEFGASIPSPTNCTAGYSSTPNSASISDGTNTTNLTTPFTNGSLAFSYTCGTTPGTLITFTLTAIQATTKTATQTISCQPRTFYGVGTSGATGATASGNNAVLTGATGTLSTWGLGTNTGTVSVSPSTQYIYFLLSTSGHTFKVNGFTTAFTCTPISFTNQFGSVINPMQLCVSPTFYTGSYSVEVQ